MNSIDEEIKKLEFIAKKNEHIADLHFKGTFSFRGIHGKAYLDEAKECHQLVEWLKELKEYRAMSGQFVDDGR